MCQCYIKSLHKGTKITKMLLYCLFLVPFSQFKILQEVDTYLIFKKWDWYPIRQQKHYQRDNQNWWCQTLIIKSSTNLTVCWHQIHVSLKVKCFKTTYSKNKFTKIIEISVISFFKSCMYQNINMFLFDDFLLECVICDLKWVWPSYIEIYLTVIYFTK